MSSDSKAHPKIRALTVRAVRVPLPEPHATASGTLGESPLVLTDIVCDGGSAGHSMIFTYTPAALKPTAELIANLAPMIVGQSAAPLEIEAMFAKRFRLLGQQGLVAMATAAIDMALWDCQRDSSAIKQSVQTGEQHRRLRRGN